MRTGSKLSWGVNCLIVDPVQQLCDGISMIAKICYAVCLGIHSMETLNDTHQPSANGE
jgi:hypothetical protein